MGDGGGGCPPMRPGVVGKGMVRATRASYLRQQVGDTRTLMQSVGSASFADQILTTVVDLNLTSVVDRIRTKIADRTWATISDRILTTFADLTLPT